MEKISPSGFITEETFLNHAQDMDSPLHKFFEWDDAKAAYSFRVGQARDLLRSIVITIDSGEEVRAFHNVYVSSSDEREYVSFEEAMKAPSLWSQVVSKALSEVNNWAKRYKIYNELSPIVSAIEEVNNNQKEKHHEEETRK